MNLNDIKGENISKLFPEAVEIDKTDKRILYSVKDEDNKSMLIETTKYDKIVSIINDSKIEKLGDGPMTAESLLSKDNDNDEDLLINIPY